MADTKGKGGKIFDDSLFEGLIVEPTAATAQPIVPIAEGQVAAGSATSTSASAQQTAAPRSSAKNMAAKNVSDDTPVIHLFTHPASVISAREVDDSNTQVLDLDLDEVSCPSCSKKQTFAPQDTKGSSFKYDCDNCGKPFSVDADFRNGKWMIRSVMVASTAPLKVTVDVNGHLGKMGATITLSAPFPNSNRIKFTLTHAEILALAAGDKQSVISDLSDLMGSRHYALSPIQAGQIVNALLSSPEGSKLISDIKASQSATQVQPATQAAKPSKPVVAAKAAELRSLAEEETTFFNMSDAVDAANRGERQTRASPNALASAFHTISSKVGSVHLPSFSRAQVIAGLSGLATIAAAVTYITVSPVRNSINNLLENLPSDAAIFDFFRNANSAAYVALRDGLDINKDGSSTFRGFKSKDAWHKEGSYILSKDETHEVANFIRLGKGEKALDILMKKFGISSSDALDMLGEFDITTSCEICRKPTIWNEHGDWRFGSVYINDSQATCFVKNEALQGVLISWLNGNKDEALSKLYDALGYNDDRGNRYSRCSARVDGKSITDGALEDMLKTALDSSSTNSLVVEVVAVVAERKRKVEEKAAAQKAAEVAQKPVEQIAAAPVLELPTELPENASLIKSSDSLWHVKNAGRWLSLNMTNETFASIHAALEGNNVSLALQYLEKSILRISDFNGTPIASEQEAKEKLAEQLKPENMLEVLAVIKRDAPAILEGERIEQKAAAEQATREEVARKSADAETTRKAEEIKAAEIQAAQEEAAKAAARKATMQKSQEEAAAAKSAQDAARAALQAKRAERAEVQQTQDTKERTKQVFRFRGAKPNLRDCAPSKSNKSILICK